MNYADIVALAFTAIDQLITLIKGIKGQGGLTPDELVAQAEAQDLQNLEDLKKLLAL